ncbi:MAG: FAD-dependent oxidoreductase [Pseudomonadota bacterium]
MPATRSNSCIRYSLEMYRGLAEAVDYPMNYHVTGALRLAHTKERMQEFERVAGMGRYQGLQMDICTPTELRDHFPFLELHDLAGGLWDPLDGDIDPAQLTQAMAKGARDLGQTIIRFNPATGIARKGSEWIVQTDNGNIRCEYVVNAAGYYAQRVGEWFKPYGGRTVPMAVMSHQYFLTDEIPEIESWTKEHGRKLPMVRDVDTSYYLRQDKHGLNLGPYERNCKAHWVTPDDPMPDDFSFQLFPDDLERLEFYIEDAMARVPLLGTGGLTRVINGPIPYAPDGLPMIGPMPGVVNAFEAHNFTFGIVQAGGAGKVLAEWITEGTTEWDMWAVDPRRYTDYTDHDYCLQKALETYGHEYAMHFPHFEWPAARNKKLSPIHDKLQSLGAQFGAVNGWERVNWFARTGDDTSIAATETWHRDGPWEPRVREECEAVHDHVGVLDLCGFSRFRLQGDGAAAWLQTQITGALPRVGRIGLGYFADARGRIVTEMSVMRVAEDHFILISAAAAQWHDFDVLAKTKPQHLTLTDLTTDYSTLVVTGPNSRALLTAIAEADLSQPWLTHQETRVADRPARLVRVSYAGELGWEIHAESAHIPAIYDAVLAGDAKPYGMYAMNALRLEKGYRAWKCDLSTDYTMLEAGLDRFVKWDKPEFTGKQALLAERQRGPAKRFATFVVNIKDYDTPHMSTVWHGSDVVGETTSGGFGYRVGASIALGVVRADLAIPGTELEVEVFGDRYPAIIQPDQPLWDPQNERLRA